LFGKYLHSPSDGSDGIVQQTNIPRDAQVEWEERVAICVLDGGLSEKDAQAVASREAPQIPREAMADMP